MATVLAVLGALVVLYKTLAPRSLQAVETENWERRPPITFLRISQELSPTNIHHLNSLILGVHKDIGVS